MLQVAEHRIKQLELEKTALISERVLAVENAKLTAKIEMQGSIDSAYDKGYARCKESLQMLKDLARSI